MWNLLLVCKKSGHCNNLSDILSAVDRRVRISCARDQHQALAKARAVMPMLAVVSEWESPKQTLKMIDVLHRHNPGLPIIVEVHPDLPLVALQALGLGATDCLRYPVAPWEWSIRCRSVLEAQRQKRLILLALKHKTRALLYAKTQDTPQTPLSLLARADVLHDAVTGGHDRRVGMLAGLIADGLGLPAKESNLIRVGSGLHDIGKLGIPDAVLKKPGRYTEDDRNRMQLHPQIGYDILKDGDPAQRISAEIALSHHEHYDGSGYPKGLEGESIPLHGRITAVADVFDALAARGGYRHNLPIDEVIDYLKSMSSRHFDRDCVDALHSKKSEAAVVAGQLEAA
jgi:two-component system response regulator RpfG